MRVNENSRADGPQLTRLGEPELLTKDACSPRIWLNGAGLRVVATMPSCASSDVEHVIWSRGGRTPTAAAFLDLPAMP